MTVDIVKEISVERFVIDNLLVHRKLKISGLGRVVQKAPFHWLHV